MDESEAVIRYNKVSHYETVRRWWAHYYEGAVFPSECLPDTGIVSLYRGDIAAVTFVYKTNAKMAHIHFSIANPELPGSRKIFFLMQAMKGAIALAKELLDGDGLIWCCTDNAVIARIYAESGLTCTGVHDVYFMPVGEKDFNFLK